MSTRLRLQTAFAFLFMGSGLAAAAPQQPGSPQDPPATVAAPNTTPSPAPQPAEKPPEKPAEKPGKWSGYVFGDFYYYAANHDASFEDQNGLWFRRIYLGYDREIASNWAIRVRMEANSKGFNETSDRLNPFIKDAYLKWTKGRHSAFVGLSPSPTWELIESVWGYRAVEKTPLDLYKWGGSRDLGLAFKGSFDAKKKLGYHAFFGTGTDTKSETDKDKKLYLALQAKPVTGWTIEGYVDLENRKDDKDVSTAQLFSAYEHKRGRAGIQYAHQTRKQGAGKADLKLDVFSVFAAARLKDKAWAYGRFDRMLDPNPDGAKIAYIPFDPTAKYSYFVAGLDLIPTPSVHFMPNAKLVTYDKVARKKPDSDVILSLTFYYTF